MLTQDGSVVRSVIDTVAAREKVDVTALEPPLHDEIDTDALSALYAEDHTPTIQFEYCDYTVVVKGPNNVEILTTALQPE